MTFIIRLNLFDLALDRDRDNSNRESNAKTNKFNLMIKVIIFNCLTNDRNGTYNLNVGLY